MLFITTDVDVDFDLDEFDDSEILYELERWIEHRPDRANKLLELAYQIYKEDGLEALIKSIERIKESK